MNDKIDERVFWKNSGWYISLREEDKDVVSFVGKRRVQIRTGKFGVIAGPFDSMEQLEYWFDGFLCQHGRPREMLNCRDEDEQGSVNLSLLPGSHTGYSSTAPRSNPGKLKLVEKI